MNYTIPMNNVKKIEVNCSYIKITYDDDTKRTIIISNDTIIFNRNYINKNNAPIIDHCI
jgi:hypothetical protein